MAIVHNPHLRHIKVNRLENPCHELQFLSANKQRKWTERWQSPNGASLGTVVEEVLSFPSFDEPDKLWLLYRLLKNRPDLLMNLNHNYLCSRDELGALARRKKKSKRRSSREGHAEDTWHHCWCCQSHVLGATALEAHLLGKRHKAHCQLSRPQLSRRKREPKTEERHPKEHQKQCRRDGAHEVSKDDAAKQTTKIQSTDKTDTSQCQKLKAEDLKHTFYCWCCRRSIKEGTQWRDHLKSKRHRRRSTL